VVFQIALSMVLVVGAGLFTRTLVNLNRASLGFDPKGIVLFSIVAPVTRYPAPMDVRLHERVEERIARVPGVEAVTLTEQPILSQVMNSFGLVFADRPTPTGDGPMAWVNGVGREFFSTYKIPILYGRGFAATDTATSPRVAVINQTMAKKYYAGVNPVGRSFADGDGPNSQTYQIVGVAGDAKYAALRDAPPTTFYKLYEQEKEEPQMTYVVKTKGSAADVMPGIRAAVEEVDKDLPLRDIRTQVEQIDATILQERLFATLTAAFGGLALVLASIGIYGLMAYSVARRTSEIGVRMALGARAGQVLGMVLGESSWLAGVGLVVGLAGAVGLARLVRSMLYGLEPTDWRTLAGAGLVLLAVALGAAFGPARRASRIDPIQALRHE
jgi:predicted permease